MNEPASNPAPVPSLGAKPADASITERASVPATTDRHTRGMQIAFALIVFAQYLLTRERPLFFLPFTPQINETFLVAVTNLDNTILAVVLLLVGGVLFASNARGALGVASSDAAQGDDLLSAPPLAPWRTVAAQIFTPVALPVGAALLWAFLLWQLSQKYYDGFLALVWLGVLALLAAICFSLDRALRAARRAPASGQPADVEDAASAPAQPRLPTLSPGLRWVDVAFIVATCVLGLAVGSYKLQMYPNSFIGDEGSFWETAKSIATGAYSPSIFDFGVYSYPILGSIYQAWFLKLFGATLWSWRFSSVVAGVAACVPTYLLARELFDRRVAALAGALLVIMPYELAFERLGYNNSQALFPAALTLYLLYAGLRRRSALYLVLGGMAAGLGFYSYTAARLGVVVAACFFAYLLLTLLVRIVRQRQDRSAAAAAWATFASIVFLGGVYVVGCAAVVSPHIVYGNAVDPSLFRAKLSESLFPSYIYAQSLFPENELFRDHLPIMIGTDKFFYRPDLYARMVVRGFVRTFLAFHHSELVQEHYIDQPLSGPITVVFYFLGLVVSLAGFRRPRFALLALWFVLGFAMLSALNTFPPRHAHLVSLIPAIAIFSALGIVMFAELLVRRMSRGGSFGVRLVAVVCFVVAAFAGVNDYFIEVGRTYKPIFEHVISFQALNLSAPRRFIYVYTDEGEQNYMPWAIRNMDTLADFQTVSAADLAANRFTVSPDNAYTFFFGEEAQAAVVPFLEQALHRPVKPYPYLNREGNVIGLSYTVGDP